MPLSKSDLLQSLLAGSSGSNPYDQAKAQEPVLKLKSYLDKSARQNEIAEAEALKTKYGMTTPVDTGAVRIGAPNPSLAFTPGQHAADVAFGKDYADYTAGGGKAGIQKNLGALQKASEGIAETSKFDQLMGAAPKMLRDFFTPKAVAREDAVKGAIQSTLRQTLGSQFTEREAQALMDRAYNPRLSAEENQARVSAVINELKQQANQKDMSAALFEKTGSLKGLNAAAPMKINLPMEQPSSGTSMTPEQRKSRILELRAKLGK